MKRADHSWRCDVCHKVLKLLDKEVSLGGKTMHVRCADRFDREGGSFVEETCKCGRVWRGKPETNPSSACPNCGEQMARDALWRRDNHFP